MSAVPADSDALSLCPAGDACPDRINYSSDLMAGDARVLDARPESLFCKGVAVADATGFDLDAHLSGDRLRDFAFNEFKRAIGLSNLYGTHLRHSSSNHILHQALHRSRSGLVQ